MFNIYLKGPESRKYFGLTQITSKTELKTGMLVNIRRGDGSVDSRYVVSPPYIDEVSNQVVDLHCFQSMDKSVRTTVSLVDLNIISNQNGQWRSKDWLENPAKNRLRRLIRTATRRLQL